MPPSPRFGGLDIIVNNAGYTWDNVIQKTTDEQFQAMLDIHLVAPFRILRAASTHIREAAKRETAEGRRVMRKVVNITSIAGTDGNRRAGRLLVRQGRRHRSHQDHGQGVGPLQRERERGGLRPDRDAPDAAAYAKRTRPSTCRAARSPSACSPRCWMR